jgi:large subunit ribosomal protein L6
MSRVGKQPIPIPSGVKVALSNRLITVESGQNRLSFTHRPEVQVRVDEEAKSVIVERQNNSGISRAMHGTTRSMIANMVQGVVKDYVKDLEINGVGWTAKVQGMDLALNVGYADTRMVPIPAGVKVEVAGNKLKVSGPDKQKVGQLAAVIRSHRPPEPYNGKGIKYADEKIVRKQGKAFAAGGAG